MSNSLLIWLALVWLVLVFVVYRWYTRHPTAEDLIKGKMEVQHSDVEGLADLLDAAGISPGRVHVVDVLNLDSVCWGNRQWSFLDRILLVPKLYGASGDNCAGVKDGRVISLSLVNHELEDLSFLATMDALKTIQLKEGQLKSFAGVTEGCQWLSLNLERNKLVDAGLLSRCINLRQLNISFNKVSALPGLDGLKQLQELNASNNDIVEIDGVAGHPALSRIDLRNNRLTSAPFNDLPKLQVLNVNNNKIESLAGMKDLPELLVLRAGSNPITEVETQVIEQFPLLQNVSLVNTEITSIPEGYVFATDRPSGSEIARSDSAGAPGNASKTKLPKIDVANTVLVEVLREDFKDTFDADKITVVEALPRGRGYMNGTSRRGRSKTGLSTLVDHEGEIATFRGIQSIGFDVDRAISVTFRASLEEGMMRAYLKDSEGRYFYKEAIPGHPLEISGTLITGTSTYIVYLESVDGTARGIKWSCN